jgi:hypothetical protein
MKQEAWNDAATVSLFVWREIIMHPEGNVGGVLLVLHLKYL